MTGPAFDYSNLDGRRRGPFLTAAGWVLRGVARVQDEVEPYAASWGEANRAALARTDGPLWVALGDSLTQGIGASAYDRGWVGQLRDRLAAAGRPYRLVNLGVSGARAADVLERQVPVLESLRPDLVTLMVGSNDLMRPKYRRGLAGGVAAIAERLPAGSVVATLPNPTPAAQESNRSLRAVAAARGLVVADLRDRRTTSWAGKLAPDHFHPNDAGYAALADVMAEALGL